MKIKLLIGALLFLILVNLATIGSYLYYRWNAPAPLPPWEERHPGRWGGAPPPPMDLAPEQRRVLRSLIFEFAEQTRDLRDEKRRLKEELFRLMTSDEVDTTLINQKTKELSEVWYRLFKISTDKLIDAKKHLTPEQQRHLFFAILRFQQDGPMRRHFRGNRPPRGPGF